MSERSSTALLPVLLLLIAAAGLVAIVLLVGRDPIVEAISPRTIRTGQNVEVRGRFFGGEIESLYVAGRRIPASAIIRWEDQLIEFAAPANLESGLLAVETDRGRSEGVLVQVSGRAPRASLTGERRPGIVSISSEELTVGSLLTIRGESFGALRRDATVLFDRFTDEVCPSCERLFFGRWSDSLIEVRVPDGVVSGDVRVKTPDGVSNAVAYSVVYPAGRVGVAGRTEIGLRYEATVDQVVLSREGESTRSGERTLMLRIPHPVRSLLQPQLQFFDQNQAHYVFEGVSAGFARTIARTVLVERSAARTQLIEANISAEYERSTPFLDYYTRDLPGLDMSSETVAGTSAEIRRSGRTPVAVAQSAYDITLERLTPVLGEATTAAQALESGYADHQGYANVMVALLRTNGIPSRVVSGVIASPERESYSHSWVEFFVPSVGWMPADPYLGDGAYLSLVAGVEGTAEFYFGNLDAMRVAFSRGLDTYDPRVLTGIDLRPETSFSQQMMFARSGQAIDSARLAIPVPRAIGIFTLD